MKTAQNWKLNNWSWWSSNDDQSKNMKSSSKRRMIFSSFFLESTSIKINEICTIVDAKFPSHLKWIEKKINFTTLNDILIWSNQKVWNSFSLQYERSEILFALNTEHRFNLHHQRSQKSNLYIEYLWVNISCHWKEKEWYKCEIVKRERGGSANYNFIKW